MRIRATREFEEWVDELSFKQQAQVHSRIRRIEEFNHFGDNRDLGEGLMELRWANGWRVYFKSTSDHFGNFTLILLGGRKNAQKKDIKKARLLAQKYSNI